MSKELIAFRKPMYNKLFSKIVDSSIWLEPTPTRIIWLMFIALMDEDGFVYFASPANVAHRARVSEAEAEEALKILEAPDPNSSDEEHEGRRIERVPGGWIVLNAPKHREIVTREVARKRVRERVAKHRAKDKCNAPVTTCNASVTQSEAISEVHKHTSVAFLTPTLKQIQTVCTNSGIEAKIGEIWWNEMQGVGWVDARGRKIVNWQFALASYAGKWFNNKTERKQRENTRNNGNNRNEGTLNAGTASQYRNHKGVL